MREYRETLELRFQPFKRLGLAAFTAGAVLLLLCVLLNWRGAEHIIATSLVFAGLTCFLITWFNEQAEKRRLRVSHQRQLALLKAIGSDQDFIGEGKIKIESTPQFEAMIKKCGGNKIEALKRLQEQRKEQ